MINIEQLTFGYSKKKILFNDLNLNMQQGNIYGLLGKNGAGKTTLLKNIAGLLFPHSGIIDVNGYNPTKRSPTFLQDIYFIPEEFYLPSISIKKHINIYAPFYPNFDHQILKDLLSEFEIDINWKLNKVSYGQKKKYLIVFGIATNSKILILDEPTNGLDIPSKRQFRKITAAAVSDERTIIISTHQVRDLETIMDPIIILDEGKIIFNESLDTISQKLVIKQVKELPPEKELVYSESTFGGYNIVGINKNSEDSRIDPELLFNAITTNKEKINEIFNN